MIFRQYIHSQKRIGLRILATYHARLFLVMLLSIGLTTCSKTTRENRRQAGSQVTTEQDFAENPADFGLLGMDPADFYGRVSQWQVASAMATGLYVAAIQSLIKLRQICKRYQMSDTKIGWVNVTTRSISHMLKRHLYARELLIGGVNTFWITPKVDDLTAQQEFLKKQSERLIKLTVNIIRLYVEENSRSIVLKHKGTAGAKSSVSITFAIEDLIDILSKDDNDVLWLRDAQIGFGVVTKSVATNKNELSKIYNVQRPQGVTVWLNQIESNEPGELLKYSSTYPVARLPQLASKELRRKLLRWQGQGHNGTFYSVDGRFKDDMHCPRGDWFPYAHKANCSPGSVVSGISRSGRMLCRSAPMPPDRGLSRDYLVLSGEQEGGRGDWANGRLKRTCPPGSYLNGLSFKVGSLNNAFLQDNYACLSSPLIESLGNTSCNTVWFDRDESNRQSQSGGNWANAFDSSDLLGQCKDHEYVAGFALRKIFNEGVGAILCCPFAS